MSVISKIIAEESLKVLEIDLKKAVKRKRKLRSRNRKKELELRKYNLNLEKKQSKRVQNIKEKIREK